VVGLMLANDLSISCNDETRYCLSVKIEGNVVLGLLAGWGFIDCGFAVCRPMLNLSILEITSGVNLGDLPCFSSLAAIFSTCFLFLRCVSKLAIFCPLLR